MMEAIVEVAEPSRQPCVGEEDRDHVHESTAYTADDGSSQSGRANLQTGVILHLPRGRRDRNPGHISVEIARRTRACWMRIRRYQRELYDQPKAALSLKTRMVKTKAIEALLGGAQYVDPSPGTLR